MGKEEVRTVWIVESVEYEQRAIDLVAESLAAAVSSLRTTYVSPYVVRWEALEIEGENRAVLTGHFDAVQGYSTYHTARFEICQWEVSRADTEAPAPKD